MTTAKQIATATNHVSQIRSVYETLSEGSDDRRPLKELGKVVGASIETLQGLGVPVPDMIKSLKSDRLERLTRRCVQVGDAWLEEERSQKSKAELAEGAAQAAGGKGKGKGKGKAKAKPTKKKESDVQVGAHGVTPRRILNAVKKLSRDRRGELYQEATGQEVPKGAMVRDLCREIARHLAEQDQLPEDVDAKLHRPKKKGPAKPKRIDTILECLRRKNGATVDEIADALLETFPHVSARWGGGPAEREQYQRFARVAISHLRAGRVFAIAKDNPVDVARDEAGRYSISV